jgi:hypothetical protein
MLYGAAPVEASSGKTKKESSAASSATSLEKSSRRSSRRATPTRPPPETSRLTSIGASEGAGLLPRLAQRRSCWVVVPPLVPDDQPTRNLARSLAAALRRSKLDALAVDLEATRATLVRCVEELRAAHGGRSVPVLLVVDQAEELLTRTGQQECTEFLSLLQQGLHDDPRLWVVATLRSDFLTELLTGSFATLFQDPVVVGSLPRAALVEAVEGPAAQAGLTFVPAWSTAW